MQTREGEYLPNDKSNTVRVHDVSDGKYTIDQAVEHIGFGRAQISLTLIAGIIWMADAMELTILSIISPEVRCEWNLSATEEALITTIVFMGMASSSSWWGSLADKFGRKVGLFICAAWTTYFGFLSALSPNYIWLLILRALTGFGIGGAPQAITLYSEFLPVKTRSRSIMAIEVFWAIGTVIEVFLALIIMPSLGFRWLLGISATPLVVVLLTFNYLPESARFNQARGRNDLAQKTLEDVAKLNNKKLPSAGLRIPKQRIKKSINTNKQTSTSTGQIQTTEQIHNKSAPGIGELFSDPTLKKTTILLWIIWFQCAFAYYGLVLLSTSLFKENDSAYSTGVGTCPLEFKEQCSLSCKTLNGKDYADLLYVTLAEFPGIIIAMLLLEYFGRKQTMAIAYFGFGISSLCVSFATTRAQLTFFLFTARALISGGFQASYVYTPEVYPTPIRALALGSCSGMARIGALLTPFVSQVLVEDNKNAAIFLYSLLAFVAGVCTLLLPIETKNRSMSENVTEEDNESNVNTGSRI